MASTPGRDKSPSARARARTPRRDSDATRSSTPRASPRRSLVTSGNLRRTRVSTGIRAALDRATRSADVTPQDGGQSPRSDDKSRTTKYVQEDGFRAGRWRDLGGRFTTPPSPGDEVISQAEALARRASLAASSAAAAADAADAAASAAATRSGEKNDAFIQHPMVGDPGLKKSKNKQIQDVDKSWEKVNQADADAA